MAQQTLQTIKSWFVRGAKPTQNQFSDTFDSFWHKSEQINQNNVDGLGNTLLAMQADIDRAVKIADPSKFMGVSGIASKGNQMWCRIARIKIVLPSEQGYDSYQQDCSFVGSIEVMSQCTNPYSFDSHFMQSGKLICKIVWSHPRRSPSIELRLNESISIDKTQFKLIEMIRDITTRTAVYDLYVRTSYMYDRFFYFYKTNIQFTNDIVEFSAIDAESPVFSNFLPTGTGDVYEPIDGTEDKHYELDFSNQSSVTINHSLNKYPSVTIVDELGNQILSDVRYVSKSQIVVSFSELLSGSIFLN